MSFIPKPHEIYKHFKGNLYQITTVAEHSETGEQLVIYQALYGDFKTYARPLDMFLSRVDRQKYPDAGQEFRFERQGAESDPRISGNTEISEDTAAFRNMEVSGNTETSGGAGKFTGAETEEPEVTLDPMVLEFLDADSYEERLNILAGLHHRITNEMITTMAIACDIEVDDGDVEERYNSLRTCLLTRERYECNRMR